MARVLQRPVLEVWEGMSSTKACLGVWEGMQSSKACS